MAIRTTALAVSKVLAGQVDDTIDMDTFIETASLIVDDNCADAGYSDAKLELIERWLSAHMYSVTDPRTTQEGAGPVNAAYEAKVDLGFNLTRFGQQAMLLDTAGGLAALNAATVAGTTRSAGISWLGKTTPTLLGEEED